MWINGTQISNKNIDKQCEILILYPSFSYNSSAITINQLKRNGFKNIKNIETAFIQNYENIYKRNCNNSQHPSTGLFSILYILDHFKNDNIYITGFDCFNTCNKNEPTPHYFKNTQVEINSLFVDAHNGEYEKNIIQDLINKKILLRL